MSDRFHHILHKINMDRKLLHATAEKISCIDPPDIFGRFTALRRDQQREWLRTLDWQRVNKGDLSDTYDDILLRENQSSLFEWICPTDNGSARWAKPFIPEKTAIPPGSDDDRERRALFIVSHEFAHHLYQWQPCDGWRLIPVQGENMFFSLEGKFSDARILSNYLEGIPLRGSGCHVVYYTDAASFPFKSGVCSQTICVPSEKGRLWGQGIIFDLRWSGLSILSPQKGGYILRRHFQNWGLRALFQQIFPSFQNPCRQLLLLLTTEQPRVPAFCDEELTASLLQQYLAPKLQDLLDVITVSSCPVFLAGWFNCRLIRSMLAFSPDDEVVMGGDNILTTWQYSLHPMPTAPLLAPV